MNMLLAGEEVDVNEQVVNSWEELVWELVDYYKPEDVWIFETGLMWWTWPKKRCHAGILKSKNQINAIHQIISFSLKQPNNRNVK